MAKYLQLQDHDKFVGDSAIEMPDGKTLIVEAAQGSNKATVIALTMVDSSGHSISTNTYCYCEGEYIGSADCPGGRVFCNCITKTVSCY